MVGRPYPSLNSFLLLVLSTGFLQLVAILIIIILLIMSTSGSLRQRRGGVGSKARRLMAVCMGGVLLFCSGEGVADHVREGLQNRGLEEVHSDDAKPKLTVKGTTARCELKQNGGTAQAAATGSLTLSQKNLTAALECVGANIASIPEDLATNVCQPNGKSGRTNQCTFEGNISAGTAVTLDTLLGVATDAQWTKNRQTERKSPNTQTWTLQLKEADLPLSEKTFFVGCQDGSNSRSNGKNACKLTVNVEARASSVGDNNVVTCTYGKNSNPEPMEVEMSTENNTLTIDCGSEGSLKPATNSAEYCDPQNTDLENCAHKFVDILPTFVTSWWATTGNSAKLTIPQTDFPEADQQILLGCVPTTTASEGTKNTGQTDAETGTPTSCRVLVTIKSSSSASYGSPTMQMLAAASGAAAVTGLIVGSL
ncbi:srs domain-containing protein [Neospora caninum Liverpool]|uniref:Srs domain-containing protein n=1 Tax=Neospora caninum (strain Liverpool) TaxID=572307 RepID=F0VA49_NEOCL|nr:srs domain-containing protein [Neospora caninum Liverpool]CBZ50538.1 srs domain-containing protein [Neospora caninum Liverpool]CEL65148.1 TPA: SRS domain-containing protein [Neospora caninum Liverpool]|eukprot:XP_003880571.1 srs domain-containing protein [Neospora caninum Liverpool]